MYLGKVVETADRDSLYKHPRHPYTRALINAIPIPDPEIERNKRVIHLEGDLPSPLNPPTGCTFHTRCPKATSRCRELAPRMEELDNNHWVACHSPD